MFATIIFKLGSINKSKSPKTSKLSKYTHTQNKSNSNKHLTNPHTNYNQHIHKTKLIKSPQHQQTQTIKSKELDGIDRYKYLQ